MDISKFYDDRRYIIIAYDADGHEVDKVSLLGREVKGLSGQQGQRQDSTYDQMKDLIPVANRMGCYDAADYLKKVVESIEERLRKSNAEDKTTEDKGSS